jgi:hypothetical protein
MPATWLPPARLRLGTLRLAITTLTTPSFIALQVKQSLCNQQENNVQHAAQTV